MKNGIRNKVDESGLIQIDLDHLLPNTEVVGLDLAQFLENGFILREKKFREDVRSMDTSPYFRKKVALYCSTEAIIPLWSWMVLSIRLQEDEADVYHGHPKEVQKRLRLNAIESLSTDAFKDARVIVKGCSDAIPEEAYVRLSLKLKPVVKSLMFGEACSAVPVYKKR